MDGVLVDTERDLDAARRAVAEALGGEWSPSATTDMIGMSASEWSAYMHDELGVKAQPAEINRRVVAECSTASAVARPCCRARRTRSGLSPRLPLGLASSANREVIDAVLGASGLAPLFTATGSVRGGRSRQACPGRVPRGGRGARRRPVRGRRHRGLGQRHPLGGRRRHAGRRPAERPLPAWTRRRSHRPTS